VTGSSTQPSDDATVRGHLAELRAIWPRLQFDDDDFVAWLGRRPAAPIDSVPYLADLLLVFACGQGDVSAVAALRNNKLQRAAGALRRMGIAAAQQDDIIQQVLVELLTATASGPIGLERFAGKSSLDRWIEVVVVRAAVRSRRQGQREEPRADDFFAQLGAQQDDLELDFLRQHYVAEVAAAAAEAGAALATRDRQLLHLRYQEHASIDAVAVVFKTHRATAARWLASAEQAFAARLKGCLMRRLRAHTAETRSIMRLLLSRIDLSFGAIFGPPEK
jgi:RNA polymerase sigma-70 factor, ECF subfamily